MEPDRDLLVKEVLDINIRKVCSQFGIQYNPTVVDELERDTVFLNKLNEKISTNNIFRVRNFHSINQFNVYRNLLYYLIRMMQPQIVVETGVLHGLTSAWLLKALKQNGMGKLISIDLPRRDWEKFFPGQPMGPGGEADFEMTEKLPGWIVPDDLRHHWELLIGPSYKYLDDIFQKHSVDIFIHDSDHSYEMMGYECRMAFEKAPNAFVIIDNFDLCNFTFEYLSKHSMKYVFMDDVESDLSVAARTAICQKV